jgi:prepilin-type N-terminal cleavage/methylation domain-containing protein
MIQESRKLKASRGFTLLELLVVISIIGILVALGSVAYTTVQKKGRDAKREGDMKAIQNGFEQYYGENGTYSATCSDMATSEIMPGGIPSDPKPGMSYTGTCTASSYCYCAQMENEIGNSDDTSCTYDNSGDEDYYCVSNLQ